MLRGEALDINKVPFVRSFMSTPREGRERSMLYDMLDESGRTIYSDAETAKFLRLFQAAAVEGQFKTEQQADQMINEFYRNQALAKASKQ
jgi:hypothetical protein